MGFCEEGTFCLYILFLYVFCVELYLFIGNAVRVNQKIALFTKKVEKIYFKMDIFWK